MYRNWRDLIKPKKIILEGESSTQSYGRFIAEPLERGFGITLGNSLRRILISSLQGAAISSIRIENVSHEFSLLPDVREDVSDILLTLKEVRLKMGTFEPQTLLIDSKGPCEVLAKDIICPSSVEILNPDLHIATLNEGGTLKAELLCRMGRGFIAAGSEEAEELSGIPNGMAVDAIFSPVRKTRINCFECC